MFGGPSRITLQSRFQTAGLKAFDPSLGSLDEHQSTMVPPPNQAKPTYPETLGFQPRLAWSAQ